MFAYILLKFHEDWINPLAGGDENVFRFWTIVN